MTIKRIILEFVGIVLGLKKDKIYEIGIMGCLAMATYGIAYGIPAKPGLIKAAQPDGTEVIINLQGNASEKYAFSEDGYPLSVDDQGYYVFMTQLEDGTPVASNNREINISERTPATLSFLAGVNTNSLKGRLLKEKETRRNVRQGPGLWETTFPHEGEQKGVVILVAFNDMDFRVENPKEFYYNMLNEGGYAENGGTGSARDYFINNSSGKFIPQFDVYGPVVLSNSYSYYGKNNAWGDDAHAGDMIIEACRLLDDEIDFTQYDRNNDGEIDNVYVFYAGYGEADGGGANTVWPHSSDIIVALGKREEFDGKVLNHYACSNEIQYRSMKPDGIGTFCHEFGHVLGLPDLYSTMFEAFTPGYWDIMALGSYNNESRTPPHYSSYERYALDWMTPEILPEGKISLEAIGESNMAYLIPTEKDNEYFLLENRQFRGWDMYLPGHGMLVWHIDYNSKIWKDNHVNSFSFHQYVDIVEADNIQSNSTVPGDPFPGSSRVRTFSSTTKPGLVSWDGKDLGYSLHDIKESLNGEITFIVNEAEDSSGLTFVENEESFIKIMGRSVRSYIEGVEIYNINGIKITTLSNEEKDLPQGIYIATTGEKHLKFIIL